MKIKCTLLALFAPIAIQACKANDELIKQQKSTVSETETAMVKAMVWQEANSIFRLSPKDWTNGVYYTGVAKAHETTKNPAFLNALIEMVKRNNWETDGRIKNGDDLSIGYPYLYLKAINTKDANIAPTVDYAKQHLAVQKPNGGLLWYWCDALFMAPPVIAKLAKMENDEKMLDAMYVHYKGTYDALYDKEYDLFARDGKFVWTGESTDKKERNGEKVFWSRGNGWVLGGLALVLEEMPKNYANRPFFENLFKEMAVKVKSLQQVDGLWTAGLLDPKGHGGNGETSGSALFTYAMAWGVNNGVLNKKEYKPVIDKAWTAIMATQKADGMVGFVQGVGLAPGPSNANTWYNYGTGAFLLAGSEILKLK